MLLAVAYWCALFNEMRVEWGANEQYAYGWFVPLLALGLLWRRYGDRPETAAPEGRLTGLLAAGLFLLLLSIFPIRFLEVSNVGWRSVWWAHGIVLLALSYGFILVLGGKSRLKHYFFPIFFLLVSIPWPFLIETPTVQYLMRSVAAITVGVIHLLGIPALRHGNLIEVTSGVVSVDGACSGVRSLQTSFMATLLLGEMFRLRLGRRCLLIFLGFALALAGNVSRTSLLTWGAATRGMEYMEKSLHDSAGQAEVFVVLIAIYLCAVLIARREPPAPVPSVARSPKGSEPAPITGPVPKLNFKISWVYVGLAWLLLTEASTAYWFHLGDQRAVANPVWSVNWPVNAPGYGEKGLSKIEQGLLRSDVAKNAWWQAEDGMNWAMIALRWAPENPNAFLGHQHTPDICFTGAGWLLRNEPAPMRLNVNGLDLPFRRYVFEVAGKTVYVFLAFWDERSPGGVQEIPLAYGFTRRVKAAWEGQRNHGFKKLEIAIVGPATEGESVAALLRGLQKIITVSK